MKKLAPLLIALLVLIGCTKVGPGTEAVKFNNTGADRELGPANVEIGYVTYNPFTTTVLKFPNRVQRVEWAGEDAVSFTVEGVRVGVGIAFAIGVQPGESWRIVQKFGNTTFEALLNGYIRDNVLGSLTAAASTRDVVPLITQDQAEFVAEAQRIINERLQPDGFRVESLNIISNFTLPDRVTEQINGIQEAQNFAEEQRQRVAAAQAQADSRRAEAQGIADANVIQAEGEAQALRILNEALEQNPRVLELRMLEKWNGVLPQVLGGSDSNGLDLLIQPPRRQ